MDTVSKEKRIPPPQIRVIDNYKKDKRVFSIVKDPEAKKAKDYFLRKMEELYSLHITDRAGIFYSAQNYYSYLRAYGGGNQDPDTYKNFFANHFNQGTTSSVTGTQDSQQIGVDVDTYRRGGGWTDQKSDIKEGWLNVLWDIVSFAPKIRQALVGKFEKAEYEVVADAIDPMSSQEIENEKLKLWAVAKNLEWLQKYYGNMGLEFEEPEFIPENKEELQLFAERGGFKPLYARGMESTVKHTFDISDWNEIKKRLIGDIFDLNVYAFKEYWDDVEKKWKIKYIDPAYATVDYSTHKDFKDKEYAGHWEDYTISQLREIGFSEEDLEKIAEDFCGYNGNPDDTWWQDNVRSKIEGQRKGLYDHFRVNVFEAEWIDIDAKQQLVRTNRFGKKKVVNQKYGEKNADNPNNEVRITEVRNRYEAKWIVGTEYLFDYGKSYDITRKDKRTPTLTYHFYKLDGKSLAERLIPIFDNFMLLWIKFQNAIALARNDGLAIDYDSISNLVKGGGESSEKAAIKRFLDTGVLFFKKTGHDRRPNAASTPVYELKGNIANVFTEFRQGFVFNAELVETLVGFSPLTFGGQPDRDAPVKTSEIAVESFNDTLRPILTGYLKSKKELANNIALWVQIYMKNMPVVKNVYKDIIGEAAVQAMIIAEGERKSGVKYGMELIPRPTDQDKAEIYESAKISLQNGRDGKPGIKESDYFAIMHLLNSGGSLRLAEMILENSIRRATKEADQRAKENLQLQNQGNIQQKQLETDGKKEIERLKADLELRNKGMEHKWKLEEIEKEAAVKPEPASKG